MFTKQLIDDIIKYKESGIRPEGTQSARWRFLKHYGGKEWTDPDGKLFIKGKIVVPAEEITNVLTELYEYPSTSSNGRDKLSYRVHHVMALVEQNA